MHSTPVQFRLWRETPSVDSQSSMSHCWDTHWASTWIYPPAFTTSSTRSTSTLAGRRIQKMPSNRTEEISASNSLAGFEAQNALLGQTRIAALAPVTPYRYGDCACHLSVPTSGTGAATECDRRPGQSGISSQFRKTGRVASHRIAGWSLTPRSEEHTSELQSLRHLVCR